MLPHTIWEGMSQDSPESLLSHFPRIVSRTGFPSWFDLQSKYILHRLGSVFDLLRLGHKEWDRDLVF